MPQNQKNTLFISYADQDIEHARNLTENLKQAGIDVFFADEALLPGQNCNVVIRKAIRNCRFFLVLLSSDSVQKGIVNKQLAQTLDIIDELPETDIFIIPARLDNCQPSHEKLRALHKVDLFPDPEKGLEKIILTIKEPSMTETKPNDEKMPPASESDKPAHQPLSKPAGLDAEP
ncbi:toll/interleukin-1 receptor domain-containing protein [Desulfococcaceae bacterium HSG7]|nr:toll/interleukin-1 receptor domain-containing protein [Desulfococcaceae bacterium HSG7]